MTPCLLAIAVPRFVAPSRQSAAIIVDSHSSHKSHWPHLSYPSYASDSSYPPNSAQ